MAQRRDLLPPQALRPPPLPPREPHVLRLQRLAPGAEEVGELLAVNWLPPYRGWDDALLCLFDLGTVTSTFLDDATLQAREIKAVHWVDPATVAERVAPYTAAMIAEAVAADATLYLENSTDRGDS